MNDERHIGLQSLVDTHEHPFVIIDRDYRIVAVNHAYEEAYHVSRTLVIGKTCHEVSHGNDKPCYEYGEVCPHQRVFGHHEKTRCVHLHQSDKGDRYQVLVNAYPLQDDHGEYYMAEDIESLEAEYSEDCGRPRMVGNSPAFLRALELLQLASSSSAPVLLEGETGTGKELAARFIHDHSGRRDKPFLTLDCPVLTESLFEAEVFGYERGAFTGSVGEKQGLFEIADGGTIFLDEVGEIPMAMQAKLLRVLETGEFRRIGGRKTLRTNARLVCATNRHLGNAIGKHIFREDLYYRVACLNIHLPPLRDRIGDLQLLVESLLQQRKGKRGEKYLLSGDALAELAGYDYPGNIRELRNILDAVIAHSTDNEIGADLVAATIARFRGHRCRKAMPEHEAAPSVEVPLPGGAGSSLRAVEEQQIRQLLDQHRGNRRKVAEALGVSERTVYRKLKEYRRREGAD